MSAASKCKLPSPQERLDLLLLGLSRQQPVKALCREAGVSRELFYRWMRGVREAALKALEKKAPGPKAVKPEKAEMLAGKLQGRVRRLEAQSRALRKDRDHWKLLAEVGRRIIRRQAWGPEPRAGASSLRAGRKKNAMRRPRGGSSTGAGGARSADTVPGPGPTPGTGVSPGVPTGGGSVGSAQGSGEGS